MYVNEEVQQDFAQAQVFQINHPSNIKFIEGQNTTFEFSVRILQGKVKFDIEPSDLPQGATIETLSNDVNNARYSSRGPRLGLIPRIARSLMTRSKSL